MKRKDYQKPTMDVVKLRHRSGLLAMSSYQTNRDPKTQIIEMGDEEDL